MKVVSRRQEVFSLGQLIEPELLHRAS